ncbi:Arc family DNA-binding protein [Burkholderia gladioli]|uniref:Arc family DNA-binding protein n=1 Tax=Burkholderia gladioli TaxID=28095 RepID=UPI00163F88C2|nr:Arc family DNA-binding protein [Burkholderia gladioli]
MNKQRSVTLAVKVRPEVRDWLQSVAQHEFRSLSAEVCMRLESAYQKENAQPAATGQALVTQ